MIKNTTPYIGKIKLKFEKYPHYSNSVSKLNKVHLNLGFTKLVSRMYPNRTMNGWEVDSVKLNLINNHTGGVINGFWLDNREPKDDFTLPNSFLTKDGNYIGDIETGWWYYKNNLKVCKDYPHGVAEKYENGELVGYYGYTHRGGQLFKVGNKLFDENWVPDPTEIKSSWVDDYEESTSKKFSYDTNLEDIVSYILFTERGSKTIETLEEAKQAAINMSKYL